MPKTQIRVRIDGSLMFMATDISIDPRAALLADLGIDAQAQARLDRIAEQLRVAAAELAEVLERVPPGTDTEARVAEAVDLLDQVLHAVEWRASEPGGESPS